MENQKILLVDTSSAFHRFYHGYKHESNPTFNAEGKPVQALKGYVKFIKKIHEQFEFDELVHVIDSKSKYRIELHPEYKGNRKESEPELEYQKALMPPMLSALGEKWLKVEDHESDDILNTVALKEAAKGNMVLVITQDKDLLQLVDDETISIARFSKDENNQAIFEYMTEESVMNKFGIRTDQIADYLAIVGDASDNIEGIKGVGPKGAAKLLAKYGDVETLIAKAAEVEGKVGKNLQEGLENLKKARLLTTLIRDVPTPELKDIFEHNAKTYPNLMNFSDWTFLSGYDYEASLSIIEINKERNGNISKNNTGFRP